jgi:hypothetical protein
VSELWYRLTIVSLSGIGVAIVLYSLARALGAFS